MKEPNDTYLWDSFKNGDSNSFNTIYNLYYEKLYKYGIRITVNGECVKDAIHDLFVKLWSNREGLSTPESIFAYLLQSLRNTLYNRIESQSRFNITKKRVAEAAVSNEFHSRRLADDDLYNTLNIVFAKLTPRQKEFIHLYYLEDFSYEDVAAILDLSIKATYKLAARAIAAIRQGLTPTQQNHLRSNMKSFLLFC